MNIEDILPLLSPEALAFVTSLVQQGDQQTIDMLLQIIQMAPTPQEGVAMVEQAIQEFMQQQGMAPVSTPPDGPPLDPMAAGAPPVGALPGGPPIPQEGVPPMPMDPAAMMPPGFQGAAPIPPLPPQDAPNPNNPPAPPKKPEKKEKKVPKYVLPKVPKVPKPDLEQIYEDARTGREFWAPRDTRIKEDYDCYHIVYDNEVFGGNTQATIGGTVVHRRSQPATLLNLVTTLATAKNEKLQVEMEPRSDGEEYQEASQDAEDFVITQRELDEQRWLEERIAEPPLPRKEAGLAALEGGFGWSWYVDPDNVEHPFQYELVPLSQLYDVGHACTRQFTLTLSQARSRYEKIKEAYPTETKGRDWQANQKVRIIVHADNKGVWKSIVWEEVPGVGRDGAKVKSIAGTDNNGNYDENSDTRWIQKPERINYGFRYFNYVVWGGSPAEALQGQENQLIAYKGYGVLTMLRKTFRLMDLFISAVATGTLANLDPAYLHRVPDGVNKTKVKRLDRRPGAQNVVGIEDKIEPLRWDISASPDSINLMNSLIAELQDVSSPALSGASGPSGVAQQISTEQASQQVIAPMIDALEKWYALMHKQRLMLALRYSADEEYNKDDSGKSMVWFESYQKRSYKGETWGQYGELKAATIEKSGVRVVVRYHDRNIQEELALSNMCSTLVNAHLMSQETALRRMGVKDPRAEIQRIFTDGALMEKNVLKALIETAVYNSENETLIAAWDKAFYADMVSGSQGSEAAPTGVPSLPASQPGMNGQGASSAMMAPGAQQVGMMQ